MRKISKNWKAPSDQLFEAQWDFKLSEDFEIDVIFIRKLQFFRFQTFFKDSLCLE